MDSPLPKLVALAVRLALAGVFLWAGTAKLGDANGLAAAIANYRVLPHAAVVALAGVLPATEILVALALVAGPCVQGAGLVGALMLGVFAAAMAQAKMRGIDLECGCFGAALHAQVSWSKVAWNMVSAALAAWICWMRPVRWREIEARPARMLLGCALAAALFAAPSAHASVVLALDLAGLVAEADHVVLATVGTEEARWSDDRRLIVTDVRLRVEQTMKGSARPGDVLVVTRLGGKLRDLALQVPGEANFGRGQHVIAFLRKEGARAELHVVGMAQGVLLVRGSGAEATAMPSAGNMALVGRGEDGALAPGRPALVAPRPLADLVAEIRRLVGPARP